MFRLAVALCLTASFSAALQAQTPQHLFFRVTVSSALKGPVSGRLLVLLAPGAGTEDIDQSPFDPEPSWVAAKEIRDVAPGASVDIDTDDIAYPSGFSQVKPGDYRAQAIVDSDHSYNYVGRAPGDVRSDVVPLRGFRPGAMEEPVLTLSSIIPPAAPVPLTPTTHIEDFVSPVLSRFYRRPIHMRALVVQPPGYADRPASRYPAVYFTHGFGGTLDRLRGVTNLFSSAMGDKKMPEMFWILLDESLPTGTHEFADSVNNGPWGQALTTEFIPYLEGRYRLDRRAGARFLNGHSSGGWATLWLQVTYPKVFGGTWSTSPDPSDFHDFSGIDLYAPHANVYHCANETPCPIVRDQGKVLATLEHFAHLEETLGPYGGQLASFEWVFSPRSADGRPLPMFDRTTGNVDPGVVEAWQRYDIVNTIKTRWAQLAPYLNGKIHVYVGTADTFYLDGAAHKLDDALKSVGARAQVKFLDGRTHMNVYQLGDDPHGLYNQFATEMYATWKATAKR
jgi:S-formylglutathione hydrolase FrmB